MDSAVMAVAQCISPIPKLLLLRQEERVGLLALSLSLSWSWSQQVCNTDICIHTYYGERKDAQMLVLTIFIINFDDSVLLLM
jgi:hypothetical protein